MIVVVAVKDLLDVVAGLIAMARLMEDRSMADGGIESSGEVDGRALAEKSCYCRALLSTRDALSARWSSMAG